MRIYVNHFHINISCWSFTSRYGFGLRVWLSSLTLRQCTLIIQFLKIYTNCLNIDLGAAWERCAMFLPVCSVCCPHSLDWLQNPDDSPYYCSSTMHPTIVSNSNSMGRGFSRIDYIIVPIIDVNKNQGAAYWLRIYICYRDIL